MSWPVSASKAPPPGVSGDTTRMGQKTFQEAWSELHRRPPAEFTARAFRLCLYPRARPFAWLLRILNPGFFREDFALIQQVALDTDLDQVEASLKDFQYVNAGTRSFLRTRLRIRVSSRRLHSLAQKVLPRQGA